MSPYENLHKTQDYPYCRAFAEHTFKDYEPFLLFEITSLRNREAPWNTVYSELGVNISIDDKRFAGIRAELQAIVAKNGWDVGEQPIDPCVGDPRTIEREDE